MRLIVAVDLVRAPDGRTMVHLQLPEGYLLVTAPDARRIAALLLNAADELDA